MRGPSRAHPFVKRCERESKIRPYVLRHPIRLAGLLDDGSCQAVGPNLSVHLDPDLLSLGSGAHRWLAISRAANAHDAAHRLLVHGYQHAATDEAANADTPTLAAGELWDIRGIASRSSSPASCVRAGQFRWVVVSRDRL